MRPIRQAIVHHSAGDARATVASIRAYHTTPPPQGRGWRDIGYHVVIRRCEDDYWRAEPGRDIELPGAHDEGENATSIGICILGNYTTVEVPADAWMVLVATVVGLCRRWRLTADQVYGHREGEPPWSTTACPGFDPEALRAAVRGHLVRGVA
ncbi:MAG TPA: peptidoglycan recognition family protein [Salinarimonas sp.]|nr:peptidoglycan recognition family protein [Salinarimonas sp.]